MCAIAGTLVPPGANQAFHVGLYEQLHHGLRHAAQEVTVTGFDQQLGHMSAADLTQGGRTEGEMPAGHEPGM